MPTKSTRRSGAMTSAIALPSAARSSARVGLCRPDEVAARLLVRVKLDQAFLARFLEQVGEAAEAVVGLVEAGVAALQRLLDHRAPDLLLRAALGLQRFQRAEHQVEGFLLLVAAAAGGRRLAPLLRRAPLLLVLAHQVVVVDE